MTDNDKEVLRVFLSKTLGMSNEEIAGLYNEAGELIDVNLLLEKDSQRVQKFKKDKDNQYKRGEIDSAEKFENHLKKKYNVESDLIGVELIDHVFEAKTAELHEKLKAKINPDDIEKHPAFIAKRTEWEKAKQTLEKEWEGKLTAKESEWNRKQTLNQVSKVALQEIEASFILPENAVRANALKDVLIRELEGENYSIQDDGSIIMLDKEGKPKEDAHGKMITFKEHTEQLASKFFDKRQANARENSANKTQQNQSGSIVIKDQSEFTQKMAGAKDATERAEIMKAAKTAGLV